MAHANQGFIVRNHFYSPESHFPQITAEKWPRFSQIKICGFLRHFSAVICGKKITF